MADNPHDGHRQRLRERYLETGLSGFQPHEALELLLTYCIPKRDVNPLAHDLISRFGSISQVLDAPAAELQQVKGIGESSAVFLNLISDMTRMYQLDKFREKPSLLTTPQLGRYCASLFVNQTRENLYLISLNIQGNVLNAAQISTGTLDELIVSARDIISIAIRTNAYAVALTHNHPGGSISPSNADIQTTYTIINALANIDVPLIDHIIVGHGNFSSMAALGYLDEYISSSPNQLRNAYMDFLLSDDSEPAPKPRKKVVDQAASGSMAAEKGALPSRKK